MNLELSSEERASFYERGFSGVYRHPLLAPGNAIAERVIRAHEGMQKDLAYPGPTSADMTAKLDSGMRWFQSSFTAIPEIAEIAAHPALTDRVASILGPDLMVWAVTVARKSPAEIHAWHTDIASWEGVTAFVGLRGMTRHSVVKLLSHTHRLGVSPYDLIPQAQFTNIRAESPLSDDEAVAAAARERDPRCELVAYDMADGDFYLFDGLTWHGSRNIADQTRWALAIFYARPDADVKIPTAFGKTPTWYPKKPECVLVRGMDRFRKNAFVVPA